MKLTEWLSPVSSCSCFVNLISVAIGGLHFGVENMKVFLDDVRETPEGWVHAYWPDEAIALLKTGLVEEISLDHDLGDDDRGTGYDVVLWIEEAVATQGFMPPKIKVHSANSAARARMESGIESIMRLAGKAAVSR